MKNILSALAALFLIFSSAQGLAEEKEDFSKLGYHPTPVGRFDFEQDPFFSMIVQELKVMIIRFRDDEEHGIDRLKRWNNFCAVGYVLPERPVAESGNYHYLRGCFQNTHHWRNERGQAQGPAPTRQAGVPSDQAAARDAMSRQAPVPALPGNAWSPMMGRIF